MVELITTFLKVFLELFKLWLSWSVEQRKINTDRMKTYADAILQNIVANTDVLNEAAFDKLVTLELKTIYNIYYGEVLPILQAGRGIEALLTVNKSLMNKHLITCRSEVVTILTSNSTMVAKAKLISLRLAREWVKQ